MLRRVRHRVAQFFEALRPRVDPAERSDAYGYLDEPQRRIFESMMVRDQQHCIQVFRRVRVAAGDDRVLLAAALLHDCGKGRVALWQRVAQVLLSAVAPGLRSRLASENGAAWRRGMWRLEHHPELGAQMVARAQSVAAGAGPWAAEADADIVRLIRHQESKTPDRRLAILQAADEA